MCKIELFSDLINFRSTMIKSFQTDFIDEIENTENESDEIINSISSTSQISPKNRNPAIDKNNQSTNSSAENFSSENSSPAGRSTRNRRLPARYQNFVDVIVLLQNEAVSSPFVESRRKEVNELLKKNCYEVVFIESVSEEIKIFNSRFVNEIKNQKMTAAFEKSRLVVQIYNDHEKLIILTQISIIQRMSQRLILALAVSIDHSLYLQDISQIYVQSTISLNRQFYIRFSIELKIAENSILKIIKSLYEVSKAKIH